MWSQRQVGKMPIAGKYDVMVAGGGFAGFGAACAAAASGRKTLLVERLEMLGGVGAAGMVGNFSYGHQYVRGQGKVFDAVLQGLFALNAIGEENGYHRNIGSMNTRVYREDGSGLYDERQNEPLFYNMTFNAAALPLVLQKIALDNGVDILYATDVIGAIVEHGSVREALIHNRSLLQRVQAHFFIDGTGEGILSRHAGAPELPHAEDGHPLPIQPSNMIFLHASRQNETIPPQGLLEELPQHPIRWSVWPEPDRVGLKMNNPGNRSYNNATGWTHSEAVIDFRRHIPRFLRAFHEKFGEGYGKKMTFEFAAPALGLRESTRIEGDYILRVEDLICGRHFSDGVAFAASALDSEAMGFAKVPHFQIPLRSLLAKGLSNVLIAGRCFSAERRALSSTRVMPTGCLMGQACGCAAALAIQHRCELRALNPAEIREKLMEGASDAEFMKKRLTHRKEAGSSSTT